MCGITPEFITELPHSTDIFVFGSNLLGLHGGGAAKLAYEKFGALWGKGIGKSGNSWALPTKANFQRTLTIEEIAPYVDRLYKDVILTGRNGHKGPHYFITEVGCGLAGLKVEDVAPLFKSFLGCENCSLPIRFINVIKGLR